METPPAKKAFIFGDSFVKMFTLLTNPELTVHKFKGATMKGLTKPTNKNRIQIETIIQKNRADLDYVIFNFGQVDYNFSCYYKLVRQEPFEEEQILKDYIEWIVSLKIPNVMIINIYPSPLTKETICGALLKYHILSKDQIIQHREKILLEFQLNHHRRLEKWTNLFKKYKKKCETEYNVKSIKFLDLSNTILDKKNRVKKAYRDLNDYNIHIRWKKLLKDVQAKMAKYVTWHIDQDTLEREQMQYENNKKQRMDNELKDLDFLTL